MIRTVLPLVVTIEAFPALISMTSPSIQAASGSSTHTWDPTMMFTGVPCKNFEPELEQHWHCIRKQVELIDPRVGDDQNSHHGLDCVFSSLIRSSTSAQREREKGKAEEAVKGMKKVVAKLTPLNGKKENQK